MKKFAKIFFAFALVPLLGLSSARAELALDTEDPLFLEAQGDFMSRTGLDLSSHIARVTEKVSYGLNNRLAFAADIKYQQDIDGKDDGFSNIGLSLVYRTGGEGPVLTDLFGGIDFAEDKDLSEFSNTIYYAGARIGRQWQYVTLSGTIKTSWIFDNPNGVAFIDLTPEAYFRIFENWTTGFGFTWRKVTNPALDKRWLTFKLSRSYGRTMYTGFVNYEFRGSDVTLGGRINVLF